MLEPMFNRIVSQHGLLHESNIYQYDTLKVAYRAIDEALPLHEDVSNIMRVTDTYSRSIVFDLLEKIRTFLLEVYQQVLLLMNNYILNHAKLMEKYQDLIIERFDKLQNPIKYYTYDYSGLYDYPKDLRGSNSVSKAIDDIIKEGENPLNTSDDMTYLVDKKIQEFSLEMLGARVDPDNLKADTKKICYDLMQGQKRVEILTKANLKKYIKEIQEYKQMKDEIKKLKGDIESYYRHLKKTYSSTFKLAPGSTAGSLTRAVDPLKAILTDRQVVQFSTARIQLNRLFNGYITLYSESFSAKLDILQDHINMNKQVITQVMTRTNVLYAVSGKPKVTDKKYDPLTAEIIT